MTWRESVRTLVHALEENRSVALFDVRIGDPATEAEVALVHERLGYELDPRFLDRFRQVNGLRLRWIEPIGDAPDDLTSSFFQYVQDGLSCGSINVPPLAELFPQTMDYRFNRSDDFVPDAQKVPILGGWCVGALRNRLRPFDDYLQSPSDSSFTNVALVADAKYPDPVCILTDDCAATLADHSPMRARAYLDFIVATCGLVRARSKVMKAHGSAGDHLLVEGVPRLASDPGEFLRYLLDQLPLERNREISAAYEAMESPAR